MTLKELAKQIGCSRATLDRVLNDREGVGFERRKEILRLVDESGYRPNGVGKILALQKKAKIGIVLAADLVSRENVLFALIKKGMDAAVDRLSYTGVQFEFASSGRGTADEQVELIDQMVLGGVMGIAISIEETSPRLYAAIRRHQEAGIHFVTFFNVNGLYADGYGFKHHIGSSMEKEGQIAAALMAKFLRGSGKVALLSGLEKNQSHQIRIASAMQKLEQYAPGIEVVYNRKNVYPAEVAEQICEGLLKQCPDLSGIIASCGSNVALVDTLRRLGKIDDVSLVFFDFTEGAEDALRKGYVDAIIGIDLYGTGYNTITAIYNLTFYGSGALVDLQQPISIKIQESLTD